ncbi:DNA replication complex GINS protein SLD5 [Eurytemora carolleeae]|uniref:DNA replication complex GINS protein SLD5 n=1 Tax=Eurytemora carolleeae TaxID=1294199 RepID=UPI000C7671D5|nr:DNA replication complex GINS protein SLD5 [Eurytemora carolleeae]|eukprot:XP_023337097.1 DNA replication complex GINS protein SLD5-like [Eurytemora affinis]
MDDLTDIFDDSRVEEEVEELTAEEVLAKLQEAWINEKNSPELLEPKMEIVECMLEQISTMNDNLETLAKGDIRISLHKMELSRIRFLINSYLRTRLDKIQNNFYFYSQGTADNPSKLSKEESEFLAKYQESVGELFHTLCLRHLPGSFDLGKTGIKPPQPNFQSAVFIKVLQDIDGLEIRDGAGAGRDETIDLEVGEQHLVQYSSVSHLVEGGAVRLS